MRIPIPFISLPSTLASEVAIFLGIALVILIVLKLGKFLFKIVFGVLANSLLGIILMFVVNYMFGMGVPINTATLVAAAIFGLPAVGTMVILKLLGVAF